MLSNGAAMTVVSVVPVGSVNNGWLIKQMLVSFYQSKDRLGAVCGLKQRAVGVILLNPGAIHR